MKASMTIFLAVLFLMVLAVSVLFMQPMWAQAESEALVAVADIPEAVSTAEEKPPDEGAYSWLYLATVAGATAATLLIVQYLKVPLDTVWKIPTRLLVYFIALAIMLVAQYFVDGLTVEKAALAVVNAFVVALAAYGSYELTFSKIDRA
jgi:hypothetical protein